MATTWKLSTEIEPNYNGGLMRAQWLKGGIRIVKTKAQRNSIPYLYRFFSASETTICYVESESKLYKLISNPAGVTTDINWEAIILADSSSFTPVGTWDSDNTSPILQDTGASGRNGEFYFVANTPTPVNVNHTGLFNNQTVTVVNGNMIVSIGSQWIAVANNATWASLDKPAAISNYVAGFIIPHTHTIADITDFAGGLGDYLTRSDTANHLIAFSSVPDSAIIEKEFLTTHYYTAAQVAAFNATFVTRTGAAGVGVINFGNNNGIDVDLSGGTDTLNIGTTNADVINIGNTNSITNMLGTTIYNNQTNLAITDKLILVNDGGATASGFGAGFEIEENALITGYFKTNGTRDGYLFNAPAIAYDADLSLASLTANHVYTLPDATGTFALVATTLSTSLTSANFWLGNGGGTAAQVAMSGDVTMINTGATTIGALKVATGMVQANAITFAKMQTINTDRLLGRDTTAVGAVEEISVGGGIEFTGSLALQLSAFTGDVTKAAGGTALTIPNDTVTYAKMQNVVTNNTFLGRISGAAGDVEELTGTQATSLLDLFATGATTKGLVPGSNGVGAGFFLQADGTWVAPGGTGHVIYNGADVSQLTQQAILRFRNGLTASDNTTETLAELGGSLIKNTLITGSFQLNANPSNFGLFSDAPAFEEGVKIMYIGVSTTPPTTPPTTGVFMWVEQVNSVHELRIMDSAGNVKGLS